MEIKTLGIIGAGQMGSGIAQVAAASGLKVIMNDISTEFVDKGFGAIEKNLDRMVKKEKISSEDKAAISSAIQGSTAISDMEAADFVIEAATEKKSSSCSYSMNWMGSADRM